MNSIYGNRNVENVYELIKNCQSTKNYNGSLTGQLKI